MTNSSGPTRRNTVYYIEESAATRHEAIEQHSKTIELISRKMKSSTFLKHQMQRTFILSMECSLFITKLRSKIRNFPLSYLDYKFGWHRCFLCRWAPRFFKQLALVTQELSDAKCEELVFQWSVWLGQCTSPSKV